jgi:hypothetical protein
MKNKSINIKRDNNFNETWKRIEVLSVDFSNNYYLISFNYDNNGLKLILKKVRVELYLEIYFDGDISSLRFADEGMRLKLYDQLIEKYGIDFHQKWTFFQAEKSEYLFWLTEQSYGLSNVYEVKHFIVMCTDAIIEIIASYDPIIRNITEQEG